MARPSKQTIEYFPHTVDHGKTLFIVEQKFGNDGYAFWFKLLELLGKTEGHYLDLNDDAQWEFLVAKTRLSDSFCDENLALLAKLGSIDRKLWENRIVWCQNLIDNVADVYKKRGQKRPQKPGFRDKNPRTSGVSVTENTVNNNSQVFPSQPVTETPQSKVKESKVKESKVLFSQNSDEFRLAELLLNLILKRNSNFKKPDIQKWATDIDLMIRIDKRKPEDIESVIKWCQSNQSKTSRFWNNNILSTSKLRKQFDQLQMKIAEDIDDQDNRRGKSITNGKKKQDSAYTGLSEKNYYEGLKEAGFSVL